MPDVEHVAIGNVKILPFQAHPPLVASGGSVQGLGDLPDGWPTLPPNASLVSGV